MKDDKKYKYSFGFTLAETMISIALLVMFVFFMVIIVPPLIMKFRASAFKEQTVLLAKSKLEEYLYAALPANTPTDSGVLRFASPYNNFWYRVTMASYGSNTNTNLVTVAVWGPTTNQNQTNINRVNLVGLAKTNSGTWAKTYGRTRYYYSISYVQQTQPDGGYIVAGKSKSFGSSNYDLWILKLDSNGDVAWQKTYGGVDCGYICSIQQTSDGGYIVAGTYFWNFLVFKLDSNGNITWYKTYGNAGGGVGGSHAKAIQQTKNRSGVYDGYIVAGDTTTYDGANYDIWILKLDLNGNITWQNTYGRAGNNDIVYSIQQTSDSGYIVAAALPFAHHSGSINDFNIWIIKLDSDGYVTWANTYGRPGDYDHAYSIQQTQPDGGYIVAGIAGNSFYVNDIWILKLDLNGNITWQKTYGGTGNEYAYSIQQTQPDGGYIVAGNTSSFDAGDYDIWVLKLDSNGNCPSSRYPTIGQTTTISPISNIPYLHPTSLIKLNSINFARAGAGALTPSIIIKDPVTDIIFRTKFRTTTTSVTIQQQAP